MNKYLNDAWFLGSEMLSELDDYYFQRRTKGEKIQKEKFNFFRLYPGYDVPYYKINSTAILSIEGGSLLPMVGPLDVAVGALSTREIIENLTKAIASESELIILQINCLGGVVSGTFELAEFVADISQTFNIVSLITGRAVSGAYLLAAATRRIYLTSESNVLGGIGVISKITRRQVDDSGVVTKNLASCEFKASDSPYTPSTPAIEKYEDGRLQYLHNLFIDRISCYRKKSREEIVKLADGKTLYGSEAIEAGLADDFCDLTRWYLYREVKSK